MPIATKKNSYYQSIIKEKKCDKNYFVIDNEEYMYLLSTLKLNEFKLFASILSRCQKEKNNTVEMSRQELNLLIRKSLSLRDMDLMMNNLIKLDIIQEFQCCDVFKTFKIIIADKYINNHTENFTCKDFYTIIQIENKYELIADYYLTRFKDNNKIYIYSSDLINKLKLNRNISVPVKRIIKELKYWSKCYNIKSVEIKYKSNKIYSIEIIKG